MRNSEPPESSDIVPAKVVTKTVRAEILNEDQESLRRHLEELAWLLDESFTIPGTKIRLGVDAILGLLPGIGDLVSAAISGYIVAQARKLGVSRGVTLRMGANVAVDALIGVIPFVGDLFDVSWKANRRNIRLLSAYLEAPERVERTSWLVVVGMLALSLLGVAALLVSLRALLRFLLS